MNVLKLFRRAAIFLCMPVFAFVVVPPRASAQWRATVGAQSKSLGHQALAFLPNEIWIHAGDSVTWTSAVDEIHTVTFLKSGQVRLPFQVGCPGFSLAASASFDGSTCLTTPPLVKGQKFTVTFPTAGNFKLVCLVHENMTGVVHVLDFSQQLPHSQDFYDNQTVDQREALLSDDDSDNEHEHHNSHNTLTDRNAVATGGGEIIATGGGSQTLSIMRFMDSAKVIHVGDTVEWTNLDPVTPHTITFGVEPQNPVPPVNAILDSDGALHGTINSSTDSVHSGLIGAAPQDQLFLPMTPLSVTRFRVTFTHAGVFPYICALHDGLGMKGKITVLP
ncbi:MAG TPA: plastocyanin/azurin family copper-binding protein [Candidatus Acidoferrum sp.]|nr:plastocyanin/azurin family copper-binding protein [Candidatus Acidoferrum sp.]